MTDTADVADVDFMLTLRDMDQCILVNLMRWSSVSRHNIRKLLYTR